MTRISRRALPTPVILLLAVGLIPSATGCKKSVETSSTTSLGSSTAETAATTPAVAGAATTPAPGEAVRVVDVTIGNSLRPDNTVQNVTSTFSPKDTIFAAVRTEGAGTATLEVKWTYKDSQTVKTDSKTINPTGPAVTEFSIQKPEGWPAGDYKVDVLVSGTTATVSKAFKVV
jgi:hypothetical protein